MSAAKAQAAPIIPTSTQIVLRTAMSHKVHRRFWQQVISKFKPYFARPANDMNLEAWRRLEYRNEYAPRDLARPNFQRFI